MSGSQPATVGELHPLHRKALRHPLILDGLSDVPARLSAHDSIETCHRVGLYPTPPCGFVVGRPDAVYCACTFYLVFKEPAGAYFRFWLLTLRSPPRLSPSGEPCNLTRRFRFVSTPGCLLVSFLSARRHRFWRSSAPNNGWGCDLKDCVRGKKFARDGPSQILRPPWSDHARFIQYTRGDGHCQPSTRK